MTPPIAIENEITTALWLLWVWAMWAGPPALAFVVYVWARKL